MQIERHQQQILTEDQQEDDQYDEDRRLPADRQIFVFFFIFVIYTSQSGKIMTDLP